MNPEFDYLIILIKATLNQQPIKMPDYQINWDKLFHLAKSHSVINITYQGIKYLIDTYEIDDNVYQKFKLAASKDTAKEATQFYEGNKIFKCLQANQIKYLPLKGWQIRNYYPHPALRTMSDIDILVKDQDTPKIKDLMQQLGYSVEYFQVGGHDVYMKSPYMNIEIHRELFSKKIDKNNYFDNIWNRLIPSENNPWQYEMTLEDTYIYMLAHMKKHYSHGGTGIRSVIDIWLYLKSQQDNLDWQYINSILKQEKLLEFSNEIINLANCWFSSKDDTVKNKEIENYIINSGTYGNILHVYAKSLDDSHNSLTNKKRKYFFNRIFPPLSFMKKRYAILNKLPFLVVFCWIIRIIILPFKPSKKNLRYEINILKKLDESTIESIKKANK